MDNQSELKVRFQDVPISEDDIYAAMKELPGYIDITPGRSDCFDCRHWRRQNTQSGISVCILFLWDAGQ
jgi:hypothetical protein